MPTKLNSAGEQQEYDESTGRYGSGGGFKSFKKPINVKSKQLEIINKYNPMRDDYHTGIRSVDDIKDIEEAFDFNDDENYLYPDFTQEDGKKALANGYVMVYSSKPIEQGGFVSPSKMMAQDYAGNGKVYNKYVKLSDVAWINSDEGQLAEIKEPENTDNKINNDNKIYYHGSPNKYIQNFDEKQAGKNVGVDYEGVFFTDNKDFAEDFSYEQIPTNNYSYKRGNKGKIYEANLDLKKPLNLNKLSAEDLEDIKNNYISDADFGREKNWKNFNEFINAGNIQGAKSYLDMNKIAKSGKYDGYIADLGGKYKGSNEYVVFKGSQAKILNPSKFEQQLKELIQKGKKNEDEDVLPF